MSPPNIYNPIVVERDDLEELLNRVYPRAGRHTRWAPLETSSLVLDAHTLALLDRLLATLNG